MTFDALKDVSNALRRAAVCDDHPPLKISDSPSEAAFWFEQVELCPDGARLAHLRWLALNDLYFLLVYLLNRRHLAGLSHNQRNWEERYKERIRNWCFARCREVQDDPDNHIDLWPRESFKSEIITFGKTIQDILRDPNETFGIFSHTRPMAKQFLRQIKQELTVNEQLKRIFPDVLWNKPEREALKWSEDDGIILKRDSNRKEATIEAWGLVDGQPTALAIDTPILTTRGWKKHGDLQVGDYVFGAAGTPVAVIYNTGPMLGKECSLVSLCDDEIVAADDHLWPVDRCINRRDPGTHQQNHKWEDEERIIVRTIDLPLSCVEGRTKRQRLPRTPTLEFPEADLPLDPYVFGLWLGDGSSAAGIITTGDQEIIDYLNAQGFEMEVAEDRVTYAAYRSAKLRIALKHMGLILPGVGAQRHNKHIPESYLFVSAEQRRALLQGLMDSDGSCRKQYGQCVFTNTNLNIALGMRFLAVSLGLKPGRMHVNDCGHPQHKPRFVISFTGLKKDRPFKLSRKLQHCLDRLGRNGRYVRRVEKIESVPVNCIQVAADDGLYLAGESLVVTHNSKRFTKLLYDDVVSRDKVSVEMIAKTTSEFENSLLLTASDPIQFRYIATYQEIGDTTEQIVNRGIGKLRQRGPFDANGDIAYVSDEKFQDLREKLSPKVFALQILLDTHKAQSEQAAGFDVDWLRYYRDDPPISSMNIYIVVDPAGKAKESNSRFALWVVGLLAPHAMYILDGVLDKFDLGSRADIVIEKHRKWNPLKVGYETYGMQADIEYLRERMMIQHYPFAIVPLGGSHSSKDERIELLIPEFRATNVWLPQKGIFYKDQEGREFDLVKEFIEKEYKLFPFRSNQKDLLDALARMVDPKFGVVWPRPYGSTDTRTGDPWSPNGSNDSGSWMAN